MSLSNLKKGMVKDTLLYLPAKIFEGIVGILTLSLYSRYFTKESNGQYILATTAINILSLLLLGWLIQSVFRYVNNFNSRNKLRLFYSTAFTAWATINSFVFIVGLIYIGFSFYFKNTISLIFFFSILMFFTYNTSQVLLGILAATRRIKLNLSLSVFSVTMKILITTAFVYSKAFNGSSTSALLSNVLIDFIVISTIILRLKLYEYIKMKMFSNKIFKKFLSYSIPLVGVNVTMSLLNLSDRFIINPLLGTSKVAIYSANYQIASSAFSMLLLAVMRGVYPSILKTWKQNNMAQAEALMTHAVRYFLLITLPAVVGISVLSHSISQLLRSDYLEGSQVIIWVSIGMLFWGLTEYSNKAWELTSNTKAIFRNSLICACLNVLSNIVFIPKFGFMAAAVNTALAYLIYLILSLSGSRKILKWHITFRCYANIIGSSIFMGVFLIFITIYTKPTLLFLPIIVFIGVIVYLFSLFITKEINSEVTHVAKWLKQVLNKGRI